MRNGRCPRCESTTVYSKLGGVGDGVVHVHTGFMSLAVETMSYVCTTCGYYENYIVDEGKLADVAKKWDKVEVGADI